MSGSVAEVAAAIHSKQSFILTSHARPDGDAIGSSVALAIALEQIGKQTTVVLRDPVPLQYQNLPGMERMTFADRVTAPADAVIVLECGDLERPGIAGLDRYPVINIDHHLGNTGYGVVNWFDEGAAACGEQVAELIDELGGIWTPTVATQLYLALSTDTGGFRYGPISARTFDICRRIVEAGVDTSALSRQIFDSFSIGRVRLMGAILNAMQLHHGNRLAVLRLNDELLQQSGATMDDTDGLVNLPLGAREVVAVIMVKRQDAASFRISLRSKGTVDVRAVAALWGGGGHHNASGCTIEGNEAQITAALIAATSRVIGAEVRNP